MVNDIDYFEIGSSDPAASKAFYESVFGWVVEPPSQPAGYSMVAEGKGGLWETAETMAGQNWAIFYVHVDDVPATLERARASGGSVAVPVFDNGDILFAHIVDPLGNRLGIWSPKPSE